MADAVRRSRTLSALVATFAVLIAPTTAQERDLRDTLQRATAQQQWAEPLAWLRARRPSVAAVVDALVEPPALPPAETRRIVTRMKSNLLYTEADLVALWNDEPERRLARSAAFLALEPHTLVRLLTYNAAATLAARDRVLGFATVADVRTLRHKLLSPQTKLPVVDATGELLRVMMTLPHAVDELDLALLEQFGAGDLLQRQLALLEELRPYRDDPRAWRRFAKLLDHDDPRVRARGSFLLRTAPGNPPIGLLKLWAEDPWVPFARIPMAISDETVLQAIAPRIAREGIPGIPRGLRQRGATLPHLAKTARMELAEAIVPLLEIEGAPLRKGRNDYGHYIGDTEHATRTEMVRLLGWLGHGGTALQAARKSGRAEILLAVLDPEYLSVIAATSHIADLRAVWAIDDLRVRAAAADLFAHRRDLPEDLRAAVAMAAVAAIAASDGPLLACTELNLPTAGDLGYGQPTSADARLILAACRLGCRELFAPLVARFEQLPATAMATNSDGHALFVLAALGQLAPWLDPEPAGRLFDAITTPLEIHFGDDAPRAMAAQAAFGSLLAGVLVSLPTDRLQPALRWFERPAVGRFAVAAMIGHSRSPTRARALALLDVWPAEMPFALAIARHAPEQLTRYWNSGGSERSRATACLQQFAAIEPELLVGWHERHLLPSDPLAGGIVSMRNPPPALLACVATGATLTSWSDRWFEVVGEINPRTDKAVLAKLAASPNPRFAAAAATVMTRGDTQLAARGLAILERMAGTGTLAARREAFRHCAEQGIVSPPLIAAARDSKVADAYLSALRTALLLRAGEETMDRLRPLGGAVALSAARIADVAVTPAMLRLLDPEFHWLGTRRRLLAPKLRTSFYNAAAGTPVALRLVHAACTELGAADPRVRRAACRLLAGINRELFPEVAMLADAALDPDPEVRAAAGR